jgi:hypothetical protein
MNQTKQCLMSGVTSVMVLISLPGMAATNALAPVDLKSAAHFTILAGAGVSSTGGGIINGDVGASPITGAAIGLTTAQVNGVIYAVNAAGPAGSVVAPALLTTAMNDFINAYSNAAGRTPVPIDSFLNPGSGNIGGMTLVPGLYKFTSTALITGGNLTLTGAVNDVWIFQVGTALTMGSGIHVILAGGAQARNIFWQVGTSATLGTSSKFKGTIMAHAAITMDATSTMEGRALAFTESVTYNGQSNSLPMPEAPRFTHIYRETNEFMTVILDTTPYFLLTLEACPDLLTTNWTTIATDTPTASPWTNTDTTVTANVTQRFYRAFISY